MLLSFQPATNCLLNNTARLRLLAPLLHSQVNKVYLWGQQQKRSFSANKVALLQ